MASSSLCLDVMLFAPDFAPVYPPTRVLDPPADLAVPCAHARLRLQHVDAWTDELYCLDCPAVLGYRAGRVEVLRADRGA